VLRNEDMDAWRVRGEYATAIMEDLRWLGITWQEGPDCGGPFAPYNQSERTALYRNVFDTLRAKGLIYPCTCSRQDIQRALGAPHEGEEEPVYPGTCRTRSPNIPVPGRHHWRFRVPDGETIRFVDGHFGPCQFVAGKDFGDFVIWRADGVPSYQLAVVADDAAMHITEVVRGADLLISTARQILIYRALGLEPPLFFHCPLVTDDAGVRLAKRHDALSLRTLRAQGETAQALQKRLDAMDQ
jgi:glutamyl-tRNA synthetase